MERADEFYHLLASLRGVEALSAFAEVVPPISPAELTVRSLLLRQLSHPFVIAGVGISDDGAVVGVLPGFISSPSMESGTSCTAGVCPVVKSFAVRGAAHDPHEVVCLVGFSQWRGLIHMQHGSAKLVVMRAFPDWLHGICSAAHPVAQHPYAQLERTLVVEQQGDES